MCRRRKSSGRMILKLFWLLQIVSILLLPLGGSCLESKGPKWNLDRFFCSVDQDGDGEIEQHEATKFLALLSGKLDLLGESKEGTTGSKDGLNESLFPHNFGFSYGGTSICAEEMLDHLQNMLTADRVVDWISHGLQLPQYAESFRQNAINGLDFPALIENESWTLTEELGVQSPLHRIKITHAIVRQVFGLGVSPGPPREAYCERGGCNAILLHWKSPSARGYPPLHKYILQRWEDGSSSWLSIIDHTTETSFLDKTGLFPGRNYSYRVQAWGGHGPSEWVLLDGCNTLGTQPLEDHCQRDSNSGVVINTITQATEEISKHFSSDAPLMESLLSNDPLYHEGENRQESAWGWICSLNCGLLILGVLSRNSCFFHMTVAVWVVFKVKVLGGLHLKLLKAQDSQYPLIRTLACSFLKTLASLKYLQTKVWFLSVCRLKYPRPNSNESGFLPLTDSYHDAVGFSAANCSFEEMLADFSKIEMGKDVAQVVDRDEISAYDSSASSEKLCWSDHEGSNLRRKIKQTMDKRFSSTGAMYDHSWCSVGDIRGDALRKDEPRSLSVPIIVDRASQIYSVTEPGFEVNVGEGSVSFSSNHGRSSRIRKRHMCHFEGCKARFDRWHSLSDWRMKFSKHYCRECQLVYCLKHTRISPHGPFGQCGLDSCCVCVNCFKALPLEIKQKLEHVNKLRVGPPAGSISASNKSNKSRNKMKQWDFTSTSEHGVGVDSLSTQKSPVVRNAVVQSRQSDKGQVEEHPTDTAREGAFPLDLNFVDERESSDGSVSDCSQSSASTTNNSCQTSSISSSSAEDIRIQHFQL